MQLSDVHVYIAERIAPYGISMEDALSRVPESVGSNPEALMALWESKHISHIKPVSEFPELAGDPSNWFLEDPSENLARGAAEATSEEVAAAAADLQADIIDLDFDDDGIVDVAAEVVGDHVEVVLEMFTSAMG